MRKLSVVLLTIILLASSFSYGQSNVDENLKSYLLADFETGEIFIENNIDEIISIASISKIMSYLVIMDAVSEGEISLLDAIIIDEDTSKINGSSYDLEEGEIFPVSELLDASMIVSGNDATYALAKHLSGSEEEFTKLMNEKARELGLTSATFYNSTGLPVQGQAEQNQMSTRDILKLTRHIIKKHPEVLDITNKRYLASKSRGFFQRNTNPLLGLIEEIDGFKTGSTNKAGYCYVSTFNINGQDNLTDDLRMIAIVMGAKETAPRNLKAKELVEYGISNFSNKILLDEDTSLEVLSFPKGTIREASVYPVKGFKKMVKNNDNIEVIISMDKIELPISKDSIVGKAIVTEDGDIIFETDLVVRQDIRKAKWYEILRRNLVDMMNEITNFLSRRWGIPTSSFLEFFRYGH